jgi:uncharacterized membrane protein YphA (DoxX/SURF4 family)
VRTDPFSDAVRFLTQPRWTTGVYWALLLLSVLVAWINWRRDAGQRSGVSVWSWVARFTIGTLWWSQSLWKLPPTYTDRPDGSGGLRFWVEVVAKYAAFPWHRDFMSSVVLPHFYLFAPLVYLGEVLVAVTLILGVVSRLGAALGLLMALNLWLGLYRAPGEWPWTYMFLIVIQLLFVLHPPGRSLGLDAILLRRAAAEPAEGPSSRLVELLT